MGICIFFDKYQDQATELKAIKGDTKDMQKVLTDMLGYTFPSEEILGPGQFENPRQLTSSFKLFLDKWKKTQPPAERPPDTFLLYVHGHGMQIGGHQCLLTNKLTPIPLMELLNLVAEFVNPQRYYVVADCCSNPMTGKDGLDEEAAMKSEEAMKRVRMATDEKMSEKLSVKIGENYFISIKLIISWYNQG